MEKSNETLKDWEDREFIELIELNIVRIATMLADFDKSVRTKVSSLNERLGKLERLVEVCEASGKISQSRLTNHMNQQQR